MPRKAIQVAARAVLHAAAFSAVLLSTQATLAAGRADPDSPGISFNTGDPAAFRSGGAADQLLQKARSAGQVRVIVMLKMAMQMEHTISGVEVARQRNQLHALQSAVATRVLGNPAGDGIVRF